MFIYLNSYDQKYESTIWVLDRQSKNSGQVTALNTKLTQDQWTFPHLLAYSQVDLHAHPVAEVLYWSLRYGSPMENGRGRSGQLTLPPEMSYGLGERSTMPSVKRLKEEERDRRSINRHAATLQTMDNTPAKYDRRVRHGKEERR